MVASDGKRSMKECSTVVPIWGRIPSQGGIS